MTDQKLRTLITTAVILDRHIAQEDARLKELKAQIAAEAETRKEEATKTDGGGRSISFEGSDGCIARVTTAGPTLLAGLPPGHKKFSKIKAAASSLFPRLFHSVTVFVPVENFRDQARTLLGVQAAPLIKLCETAGKTTVSFETKEPSVE
jgi:hypothetical protein